METWDELEKRQQLEVEQTMAAREKFFNDLKNSWGGNVPHQIGIQAEIDDRAYLDWLGRQHYHQAQMHPDCPEYLKNEDYIQLQNELAGQAQSNEDIINEVKLANNLMVDAPIETPEEEQERISQTISDDAYKQHLQEERDRLNNQLFPQIAPKPQPTMEEFMQQQQATELKVLEALRNAEQQERNTMEELMRQNAQDITRSGIER